MKKGVIWKILKYAASLLLAAIILYFLFKNQDPIQLAKEIQKVDAKWVVFSMLFGASAYVIRGLRWLILIEAMGYQSSKKNSISAVSIGYFTNLFIPRAGEISRCTSLSQSDKIPMQKLFGTILIERIIDLGFLLAILSITLLLKFTEIQDFLFTLEANNLNIKNNNYILIILSICIIITSALFIFKKWFKQLEIYKKIIDIINGFKEGVNSIRKIRNKSIFWIHSFNIWLMYFLMTYICFFSMQATLHLSVSDGLFLLFLGGIGMIIPTPGGIGSYHAIVMIGLSVLGVGSIFLGEGGDPKNPALIFPTIVHVAQTLVAIIMGLFGLLTLFLTKENKKINPS
jgi:uncharacterized protein (TIRG00374 family)